MRTLYEDAYFHVAVSDADRLVRFARTGESFASIEVASRAFDTLIAAIETQPVAGYALLVDARAAIGRNDTDFESMMAGKRARLFGAFGKRAILLRTVAGVLQSQRLERESGGAFHVETFTDEAKALAYLRS